MDGIEVLTHVASPAGSGQNGATLEFKFSLPEVVVKQSWSLDSFREGQWIRAAPANLFEAGRVCLHSPQFRRETLRAGTGYIEFSTDKAMPPGNGDKRELALVAVSVARLPVGLQAR